MKRVLEIAERAQARKEALVEEVVRPVSEQAGSNSEKVLSTVSKQTIRLP